MGVSMCSWLPGLKSQRQMAKAICVPTVIPHSLTADAHCILLTLRGLLGSFAFALSNERPPQD